MFRCLLVTQKEKIDIICARSKSFKSAVKVVITGPSETGPTRPDRKSGAAPDAFHLLTTEACPKIQQKMATHSSSILLCRQISQRSHPSEVKLDRIHLV